MRPAPDRTAVIEAPPVRRPRPRRAVTSLLALAVLGSCVSYDPTGPAVPAINGTYATVIQVDYLNYFERRSDTLAASLTLWDTHYRGHFGGYYRIGPDSGRFEGALRPEGTLTVTDWGAPPKPLADIAALHDLYPWCDFAHLGAGPIPGALRGDTLVADATASVPCFYQLWGGVVAIGTTMGLHVLAVR